MTHLRLTLLLSVLSLVSLGSTVGRGVFDETNAHMHAS